MASEGRAALMTEDALGQWILRRLGAPIWPIQMCQEHIDDAIESAKRWFSSKKGLIARYTIRTSSGVPDYDLCDDVDTVLDVSVSQNRMDLSLVFSPNSLPDERIPYDVFAAGGASGGLYSSYVQTMQYTEMAKRILSAEFEWRHDRGRDYNKLYIAPTPREAQVLIVDAKIGRFSIATLTERDHELIKRYAYAFAMRDLGYFRSTLSEYPGAQGSVTMNGDRLIDESKEMLEKLDEEIILTAGPTGFVTG